MPMPLITVGYAVSLILLGVGAFFIALSGGGTNATTAPTAVAKITALIPAFAAVPFLLFGGISLAKPSLRKHLMHAAAGLALLLVLGGLGMSLPKLIPAGFSPSNLARPLATFAQLVMGLLSTGYLALCIKSFIDARRSRAAAV